MNTTDLAIILASLAVVVSVGLWASRRQGRSARDYFLASRQLPWWIIGAAFVSTSVSSEQIVGTVGIAYETGMGVANWEWFILPQYTLLMLFFIPLYLKNRITTVPELLARRYGPLCQEIIYSCATLVAYVFHLPWSPSSVRTGPKPGHCARAIDRALGPSLSWMLWVTVAHSGAAAARRTGQPLTRRPWPSSSCDRSRSSVRWCWCGGGLSSSSDVGPDRGVPQPRPV